MKLRHISHCDDNVTGFADLTWYQWLDSIEQQWEAADQPAWRALWATWSPFSNTGRLYTPRLQPKPDAFQVTERRCFAWSQCYGASLFDIHLAPDPGATYFPAYRPQWTYDGQTNCFTISADETFDPTSAVFYDFVCQPASWSARTLSPNPWRTAALGTGWHPHDETLIYAPAYWKDAFAQNEPIHFRIYPLLHDARRINDPQEFTVTR